MSSPIGHALAGIAVAWIADLADPLAGSPAGVVGPEPGPVRSPIEAGHRSHLPSWYKRAGGGLMLACAVLAAAPDLDLLFFRFHRTATHSLTSVAFVALISAGLAARMRKPVARVAAVCAIAWASHLLLDWLSADQSSPRGFQLLWPFDATWFISGWDVFPGTERRRLFSAATIARNTTAVLYELAVMAPIVAALWLVRVKALARLSSKLPGGNQPAE